MKILLFFVQINEKIVEIPENPVQPAPVCHAEQVLDVPVPIPTDGAAHSASR